MQLVSRRGLRIEVCSRNQPSKTKLALPVVISCYLQLCVSNKMEHFSYKGGCGICISRNLNATLFTIVSYISAELKYKTVLSLNICTRCYVLSN